MVSGDRVWETRPVRALKGISDVYAGEEKAQREVIAMFSCNGLCL